MNSLLQQAYAVWTDTPSHLSKPAYTIQSVHPHLLPTTPVARHLKALDYVSPRVFHPDRVSEHQQVSIAAFPQVTLEVMHLQKSASASAISLSHIVQVVSDYLRFFQHVLPASAFKASLHLGLAFSPVRKQLPKKAGAPIEPEHVNGGVTWKLYGLVFVYRQEEWEKVLLHELLHFYEFDFHPSSMSSRAASTLIATSMATQNNIRTRATHQHGAVAINEAYTEALATILYVAYSILCKEGTPYSAFLKSWREAMASAQEHFHRQMLKFIYHFRGGPWTETTHAFAYYVCKAALLFDLKELMAWSNKYQASIGARLQNRTAHADAYARFLESRLNAPRFVKSLCKFAKTMSIKTQRDSSLIMLSFQS